MNTFIRSLQYYQKEKIKVLADEYSELIRMNCHELLLQPFEFTQLSNQGVWDQKKVIEDIRNQRFGLILIGNNPTVFLMRH